MDYTSSIIGQLIFTIEHNQWLTVDEKNAILDKITELSSLIIENYKKHNR